MVTVFLYPNGYHPLFDDYFGSSGNMIVDPLGVIEL